MRERIRTIPNYQGNPTSTLVAMRPAKLLQALHTWAKVWGLGSGCYAVGSDVESLVIQNTVLL